MNTVRAHFQTSSGRVLKLGPELGSGGEATIYHVDTSDLAVKLYTDGRAVERMGKVRAMVADRLFERTPVVAFPIEAVTANGQFAGFTMRKVLAVKPMLQLCLPNDRKVQFPKADFRFLIHSALNFARAAASVHQLGCVIGDVNESGALVAQDAMTTLVDADSFQFRSGHTVFRCLVGKDAYTPPELQGKDLGSVDRTVNHDGFGIAIVIFQLLFMGRHPFAGVYNGPGEQPSIYDAIKRGRFAYSPFRSQTMMTPPPHVPVLADIPMDVASAFQRAFATPVMARPTAADWVVLMEAMTASVIQCSRNASHYYSRTAPNCPWCRLEAGLGTILFMPSSLRRSAASSNAFDLDYVVLRFTAMDGPGHAPDLASLMALPAKVKPSAEARQYKSALFGRRLIGLLLGFVAIALMVNRYAWGFFILVPAGITFFGDPAGTGVQGKISGAKNRWNSTRLEWENRAGSGRWDEKKQELLGLAQSYRGLPAEEQRMVEALERKKRELQLRHHLVNSGIAQATIKGITDSLKITLRSFGISTAFDITEQRVRNVPGFGEVRTKRMVDWRKARERGFLFNAATPTDPSELAKVYQEISGRRASIEGDLLKGIAELEGLKNDALRERSNARQYQADFLAFRQAEIDEAHIR